MKAKLSICTIWTSCNFNFSSRSRYSKNLDPWFFLKISWILFFFCWSKIRGHNYTDWNIKHLTCWIPLLLDVSKTSRLYGDQDVDYILTVSWLFANFRGHGMGKCRKKKDLGIILIVVKNEDLWVKWIHTFYLINRTKRSVCNFVKRSMEIKVPLAEN